MQKRIKIFALFCLIVFVALFSRLFYWQVYKGKELSVQARGQYQNGIVVKAPRGDILSKDGSWLAASREAYLLYASIPNIKEDAEKISEKIAPFFVSDSEDEKQVLEEISRINSLLTRDGAVWVPIKRKLTRKEKENIEKLKIEGLGFEMEEARAYPEASMAAHILGFLGKNNEGEDMGYFGLEGYYDVSLTGKEGFISREADALGIPIMLGNTKETPAIKGVNLLTHIDKTVQLILEKKLKEGISQYGAKSGTAIVMDPKTGSVLGMSSFPSFEPQNYSKYTDELFSNPAISMSFEPGSVFKIIVMASGLDAGVISPNTQCDTCSGPVKVDKYEIGTWDDKYYPDTTMTDVIVHSDNVGMVFISKKLGTDRMCDYLKEFGIGELTGIDLQGEQSPPLREKNRWNIVDLATASFGQGVAVTPIQMIRAASVIANKGIIVTPQVVDKLKGEDWHDDIKPKIGKRVISQKAAEEITLMMVEAAKKGEAKWTYSTGFRVAGKTGTAQIPISGHYDEERTIASFIGFSPYDNPEFIMLITLREPSSSPWASETAAPLWYNIAKDLFPYFGIQPESQ